MALLHWNSRKQEMVQTQSLQKHNEITLAEEASSKEAEIQQTQWLELKLKNFIFNKKL